MHFMQSAQQALEHSPRNKMEGKSLLPKRLGRIIMYHTQFIDTYNIRTGFTIFLV